MEGTSLWRTGKENSDKKERSKVSDTTARGVIGMMAVIFIFQAVTFTIHKCSDKDTGDSPVSGDPAQAAQGADSAGSVRYSNAGKTPKARKRHTLFRFDPNTISQDSLQLLGFSYKQALAIIHYRDKGGRFRKKEDFSKMYTVSPQKYRELAPYIIIPQAFKNVLPALSNELIALLKETSIVGYIAVVDITKAAALVRARTFDAFIPLMFVSAFYLLMVTILTFFQKKLEKTMQASDRK